MKVVLDHATIEYLKKYAEPFESPLDVLKRRLIDFQPPSALAVDPSVKALTNADLHQPVIDALKALGGQAHKNQVLGHLEKTLPLTPVDWVRNKQGRPRWQEKVGWVIYELRKAGKIAPPGAPYPEGVWALTTEPKKSKR